MITKTIYKALCIIKDARCITARTFAQKMWPDSIAWGRMSMGYNGYKGKGIILSAGSYLHKLWNKKYVTRNIGRPDDIAWEITDDGLKAVEEYKNFIKVNRAEVEGER